MDKRIVVEFSCDWRTESAAAILTFLQRAIVAARGRDENGKYMAERLDLCAGLKEVVGGRLLGSGETMVVVNMALPAPAKSA